MTLQRIYNGKPCTSEPNMPIHTLSTTDSEVLGIALVVHTPTYTADNTVQAILQYMHTVHSYAHTSLEKNYLALSNPTPHTIHI